MGGRVRMIDVGGKPDSEREAVAKGTIRMQASTFKLLREGSLPKGDVLAAALAFDEDALDDIAVHHLRVADVKEQLDARGTDIIDDAGHVVDVVGQVEQRMAGELRSSGIWLLSVVPTTT